MTNEGYSLLEKCRFYRLSESFQFCIYDKGEWKDCFVVVLLNESVVLLQCEELLYGKEHSNRKMLADLLNCEEMMLLDKIKIKREVDINEKLRDYVKQLLTN